MQQRFKGRPNETFRVFSCPFFFFSSRRCNDLPVKPNDRYGGQGFESMTIHVQFVFPIHQCRRVTCKLVTMLQRIQLLFYPHSLRFPFMRTNILAMQGHNQFKHVWTIEDVYVVTIAFRYCSLHFLSVMVSRVSFGITLCQMNTEGKRGENLSTRLDNSGQK